MKRVVGISLGTDAQDFAFKARFLGKQLDVRRIGTNHSVARAEKLLRHWEYHADAIGVGVAREGGGYPRLVQGVLPRFPR